MCRVYCAFVDYSKAFDLIKRSSLWLKLLDNNIDGKILKVIQNLYVNAKSCVKLDGKLSDYFGCFKGVRQGENLSPVLFAIYLNDFQSFLSERCSGLQDLNSFCDDEFEIYLRLYVLLYADDTIILAESAPDLQNALSGLHDYCDKWELKVNLTKTKIVIFARGKVKKYPIFKFGDKQVEVTEDYVYLGVTFNYNGSFRKAMEKQIMQARKAMYSLLQKARILKLPFDIVFELYEQCVIPVLLYGSEIWGFENLNSLETFHRKFFKLVLKSFRFTPNCMIYGETNSVDIKTKVNIRMAKFWLKMKACKKMKISVVMNSVLSKMSDENCEGKFFRWPTKIKDILASSDLAYLWHVQDGDYIGAQSQIKGKCIEIFLNNWKEEINSNSQCTLYRIFKNKPQIENYLIELSYSLRISTVKFLTRTHHLPITYDRFNQQDKNKVDRKCKKCDLEEVGDENHYIFTCNFFAEERLKYLPDYSHRTSDFDSAWKIMLKYTGSNLIKLATFIRYISSHFEYDGDLVIDKKKNDWEKIKRRKTSRTGRVLKPPIIWNV